MQYFDFVISKCGRDAKLKRAAYNPFVDFERLVLFFELLKRELVKNK